MSAERPYCDACCAPLWACKCDDPVEPWDVETEEERIREEYEDLEGEE